MNRQMERACGTLPQAFSYAQSYAQRKAEWSIAIRRQGTMK
jgi:hypothetical protein